MSDRQRLANRTNAKKSTGPVTSNGKATASRNASQHGLLSSRLILDDEDPTDFELLQRELQRSLDPVGAMELALVERITVNIWRQRRLVAAETAQLQLAQEGLQIAQRVTRELDLGYGRELSEKDIEPFDDDQVQWCTVVIDEIDALEEIDLASLKRQAPHVFGQLEQDADEDEEDPESFLENCERGLTGYVAELHSYCKGQIREANARPHILKLADLVRTKGLVLPSKTLELFTRYQTTLDNQIYKALKALREAQVWRLKTLEGAAEGEAACMATAA